MQKRTGDFLIEKGVITETQRQEILVYGERHKLRFGDAGLQLGILTEDKLIGLFGPDFDVDFFHLDKRFFPKVTQDLFPVDMLLKYGALPLGFKTEYKMFRARKILNLGMLTPKRTDFTEVLEKAAQAKLGPAGLQGIQVFLVLADQYLEILEHTYGITDEMIRSRQPQDLDETLAMSLENASS